VAVSSAKTWANGWASAMEKQPPGRTKWPATSAQRGTSGSQPEHPEGGEHHVGITLQVGRKLGHVGDHEAGLQAGPVARSLACSTARSEKSAPVTRPPAWRS
jgi:hypothetical protein